MTISSALFDTALGRGRDSFIEVKFRPQVALLFEKFIQAPRPETFRLLQFLSPSFADGVRVAITGASGEGVFR